MYDGPVPHTLQLCIHAGASSGAGGLPDHCHRVETAHISELRSTATQIPSVFGRSCIPNPGIEPQTLPLGRSSSVNRPAVNRVALFKLVLVYLRTLQRDRV